MIHHGKRNVLGVSIDAMDYESAVAKILECARSGKRCTTTALAVHGLTMAALDRQQQFRLNSFDLAVPDGQPVRWALNLLYDVGLRTRVYGPKLMILVCQQAALQRIPVFFYGSREVVLHDLCERMPHTCPGLQIAGFQASRFRSLTRPEHRDLVKRIAGSGARILFAGLGCPRQEIFAYEMGEYLNMPILAVGAAFDYHAGILREPPSLIQDFGLQWLYRLLQEPRRLWRRYLIQNAEFVTLFILQWMGLWRPNVRNGQPPPTEMLYG